MTSKLDAWQRRACETAFGDARSPEHAERCGEADASTCRRAAASYLDARDANAARRSDAAASSSCIDLVRRRLLARYGERHAWRRHRASRAVVASAVDHAQLAPARARVLRPTTSCRSCRLGGRRLAVGATGSSARRSTCTASCSRAIRTCAASSPTTASSAIRSARISRSRLRRDALRPGAEARDLPAGDDRAARDRRRA